MRLSSHGPSGSSTSPWTKVLLTSLLGIQLVHAQIQLDLNSDQSIKDAAKVAAEGMVSYYTGYKPGDVPGNLPDPYYWWEAGAMFGALIDYWYLTGDDEYNDITTQAMLHQVGDNNDYMPQNQSRTLGNDDQGFWGLAAMTAAENKYPNPPKDKPQWLSLAQAVFNTQASRWYNQTCNGGLKWQIYWFNNGYAYKNSISNGCFFNLAARLALYTGNQTYADWAVKTWDWMEGVGFMSKSYQVFDGAGDEREVGNCTNMDAVQWSYNNGVFMLGAAAMYNFTNGSDQWKTRIEGLIKAGDIFFSKNPMNVMTEVACEPNGKCNIDQRSFKAYLARWMAGTTKLASFTIDLIMPKLQASAKAAALQCSGPNNACGLKWTQEGKYDGMTGVGEQMAALEIFQSNLVKNVPGPANNKTGISKGDPAAGTGSEGTPKEPPSVITTGDRVGAGFVTTVILLLILGGAWWMMS